MTEPLLSVRDLKVNFYTYAGVVKALDGVSFDIYPGETFGIVGETGCGKSVTAASIIQLIEQPGKIVGGEIFFKGEDLLRKTEKEMREIRGSRISIVFQDPMTYLNPVLTIGEQISEVITENQDPSEYASVLLLEDEQDQPASNLSKKDLKRALQLKAAEVLEKVRMPDPKRILSQYSHELSGGMRQRAMIAMAISCNPELLILDEATTFLDVTIQKQIMELVKGLQKQLGCTLLIITHDMGIIAEMCDRMGVMYAGNIVECSRTEDIFDETLHPYTRGLLAAIPSVKGEGGALISIPGSVPNLIDPPTGCRFNPRCPNVMDICKQAKPALSEVKPRHLVACHLYHGGSED